MRSIDDFVKHIFREPHPGGRPSGEPGGGRKVEDNDGECKELGSVESKNEVIGTVSNYKVEAVAVRL